MTLQEEFERAQDATLPKQSLVAFEGLWVALRGGYVVAADLDPIRLREHDAVCDDDVLLAVPPDGDGALIL
jgi:hypothetical protein